MTLADLNAKDRAGFVEAVGWAFEESPWVADRAWAKRPFASLDELHDVMVSIVTGASQDEQLALLRAHPDLGAVGVKPDSTGRVRLQADREMSGASQREQTGAGLDSMTRAQLDRLQSLNAVYREKFGFPFLFAVKGSTTEDILNALERRLPSARGVEQQEALRQVSRIARFRLEDVIS
jgi:2-oxo-4-hydroxy-4-carboxy-5-ureidoimidazoline decarboxylase